MNQLDKSFWTNRWEANQTGWDIGGVSPAIQDYINSLQDKSIRILIPGAGNAYEADYLRSLGFHNVFICDWAKPALDNIKRRLPDFPEDHLLEVNFFELDLEVDLILEQTFFCALDPALRTQYVSHCHQLLKSGGKVAGLLFAKPFPFAGPPFGGTKEEYHPLFSSHFEVLEMEISQHSIPPRLGNELFFEMVKK